RMIAGEGFSFLNLNRPSSGRILWSPKESSRLWLYHLNYFDFVDVDLSSPKDRSHLARALELMVDWCEQNVTGEEVGWEPYPLSMRIVNWLKFLARNAETAESLGAGRVVTKLLGSLQSQVLTLESRLETDLRANHLLKNIKALIFAGALLDSPESSSWQRRGAALLAQEMEEQVLSDGGHFERSPMYHAQILEDLLDIQSLGAAQFPAPSCLRELPERIGQMAKFLFGILHPDGEIPLFNDAAFGIASPASDILTRVPAFITDRRPEITLFRETGYAVIRDRRAGACLIFDCGPLGPNYQLGHGHCDVLSYELSLHGARVVVDTGVSTYERTPERHYQRSTAAHNTVRVDGEDQAEIWASFRAGRRPQAGRVQAGIITGCRFVRAEHSGYRHRGVMHHRTIFQVPDSSWLVVDWLRGRGKHRIESFIHFHPGVLVEPCAGEAEPAGEEPEGGRWLIRFGSDSYYLLALGGGEMRLKETCYSPEFGLRQMRASLHWSLETTVPCLMAYAFAPAATPRMTLRRSCDQRSIRINQFSLPLE
ncbi:MAG: heparinase II/III family protein, partial [Terriglobia bacterium]